MSEAKVAASAQRAEAASMADDSASTRWALVATPTCQRFGRVARLRPGAEAEYDRLHAAVWPEVLATIVKAGIRNYTIYRHDEWLFSYFELATAVTLASVIATLEQSPACRRWEEEIRDLREMDWQPMAEVFHQ